jgi:copper transport protein
MPTGARRLAAAAVLAVLLVPATATTAWAHALVERSDPPAGAMLASAPTAVTITFTEPPDPALSLVHVLDSTGNPVETGPAVAVATDPLTLRVPLGLLPDGAYTVTWRVVSQTDGHLTTGSFSFGVGVPATGAVSGGSPVTSRPSALAVASRWALYCGLAIALAAGVVGLVAFGGSLTRRKPILLAAVLLTVLGAVGSVLAERSTAGVSLGTLLTSSTGSRLVRLLVTAIAAALVAAAAAFRSDRRWLVAAAGMSALALLARVTGGHAAGESPTWFNEGVQWIHIMAASIWAGGLVWLLSRLRAAAPPTPIAEVRRFSTLAGLALLAVGLTGLLRAVDELGGWSAWSALVSTSFGVALLVKLGLVAVLVAFGAWNRFVAVPALFAGSRDVAALRRSVLAEVVLAGGVFAATAVLVGLPPAATASSAAGAVPARVVASGSDFATSVRVRLVVTPGTAGPNRFDADVTDYDTGEPAAADGISLRFSLPDRPGVGSTLELTRAGGARWTGEGTDLSIAGRWDVTVLVQRAASPTEVPLEITIGAPSPTPSPSAASGPPSASPGSPAPSASAGQTQVNTLELPDGGSLLAYVYPGAPGANQFHATAFDASGTELPLQSFTVTVTGPSGAPFDLQLQRFSPGHFVADVYLQPGSWRFDISGRTADGVDFQVSFEQAVEG